jgi:hypothetical protein
MVVSPNPPLELTRGHDACGANPMPADHHTRSIWGNLRILYFVDSTQIGWYITRKPGI